MGEHRLEERVRRWFQETCRVREAFAAGSAERIAEVARLTARQLGQGRKVLAFGNGGSAADAQHLAAELVNRFMVDRPPLAAVALTTDTSILTAVANDFGFDQVFEKQVLALAVPGDVAIGMTTSGRSPNVLRGLAAARQKGCTCIGLAGEGGAELEGICHHVFRVPSRVTPWIQECHTAWAHVLCDLVDEILYPGARS